MSPPSWVHDPDQGSSQYVAPVNRNTLTMPSFASATVELTSLNGDPNATTSPSSDIATENPLSSQAPYAPGKPGSG